MGAFKVRGGLVYFDRLTRAEPRRAGVITATRGNHGQSSVLARRFGLSAIIVVPHGNSAGKNAAMRAQGVDLIEQGHDFQASLESGRSLAGARLHFLPNFPGSFVAWRRSSLELLRAAPELEPSCSPDRSRLRDLRCDRGAGRARGADARSSPLSPSPHPPTRAPSRPGYLISHVATTRIADGMACRIPVQAALDTIRAGATSASSR